MGRRERTRGIGCSGILFFIISFIVFCAVILEDDIVNPDFLQDDVVETIEPIEQIEATETEETDAKLWFYYKQLDETEKAIYDGLLTAVKDGKSKHTFQNADVKVYENALKRVVLALAYDHPEYYWLNGGYQYTWQTAEGETSGTVEVELFSYAFGGNAKDSEKQLLEVQTKINTIIAEANQCSSTYEKIMYVHDYLIQNVVYDYATLAEAEKKSHKPENEYIYSVYGSLINGKSVCAGYAKAFQLILNNMGIPCGYVAGEAGEPHAWNIVELDGQNYFVDVTWDDRDMEQYPSEAEYGYFFITTSQLTTTHTIDESLFDIPVCTANVYNYYKQKGYLLDTYDRNALDDLLKKRDGEGILDVQFSTKKEYKKALKDLFEKNNLFELKSIGQKTVQRITDDNLWIITLYL